MKKIPPGSGTVPLKRKIGHLTPRVTRESPNLCKYRLETLCQLFSQFVRLSRMIQGRLPVTDIEGSLSVVVGKDEYTACSMHEHAGSYRKSDFTSEDRGLSAVGN
jgi:hypothetical protein